MIHHYVRKLFACVVGGGGGGGHKFQRGTHLAVVEGYCCSYRGNLSLTDVRSQTIELHTKHKNY